MWEMSDSPVFSGEKLIRKENIILLGSRHRIFDAGEKVWTDLHNMRKRDLAKSGYSN